MDGNRIPSRGVTEPSQRIYAQMVHRASRKTAAGVTVLKAFGIGGTICLIGEILRQMLLTLGLPADAAGAWVSVILVFCSALLTGLILCGIALGAVILTMRLCFGAQ